MSRNDSTRGSARRATSAGLALEALEGRALLSHVGMPHVAHRMSHHAPAIISSKPGPRVSQMDDDGGTVRKAPHFYEFYTGPQRADLDVVEARVQLSDGQLVFRGRMAGNIDTTPAAGEDSFYVFGLNR